MAGIARSVAILRLCEQIPVGSTHRQISYLGGFDALDRAAPWILDGIDIDAMIRHPMRQYQIVG
jgi:hypothetical protein